MANYDPSEGRGGRPDLFLINLPPDIKVTRTYFTKSEPELKHVPDIFRHDMPKMGKVSLLYVYFKIDNIISHNVYKSICIALNILIAKRTTEPLLSSINICLRLL